ncbi:MAG TPA: STAS domain-containing protein [Polyangiaceae bacterium]|nr:STAS domain-containing protein [Polyangiaceae bacterium]
MAAPLFMRRMAELTESRVWQGGSSPGLDRKPFELLKQVALYEIARPLFFGAAQRGMAALDALFGDVLIVLDLSRGPVIDASGLVALESALDGLQRGRRLVILSGPRPEPKSVFDRAELERHRENIMMSRSVGDAIAMARDLVLLHPEWATGPPLRFVCRTNAMETFAVARPATERNCVVSPTPVGKSAPGLRSFVFVRHAGESRASRSEFAAAPRKSSLTVALDQ